MEFRGKSGFLGQGLSNVRKGQAGFLKELWWQCRVSFPWPTSFCVTGSWYCQERDWCLSSLLLVIVHFLSWHPSSEVHVPCAPASCSTTKNHSLLPRTETFLTCPVSRNSGIEEALRHGLVSGHTLCLIMHIINEWYRPYTLPIVISSQGHFRGKGRGVSFRLPLYFCQQIRPDPLLQSPSTFQWEAGDRCMIYSWCT